VLRWTLAATRAILASMDAHDHPSLDTDGIPELPPNRPPGILGEPGLNVMKVDTFEPDGMNAGLTQEDTFETRFLLIALAYLLFFPAAFVMVWVSKRMSLRTKVIVTAAMLAGLALVVWALR
jgi:hypothetical protein